MESKEKLISDLNSCFSFIRQVTELHKDLESNQANVKILEAEKKKRKEKFDQAASSKKAMDEGTYPIPVEPFFSTLLAAIPIGFFGIIALWVLEFIVYLFTDSLYKTFLAILTNVIFYIVYALAVLIIALIYHRYDNNPQTLRQICELDVYSKYNTAHEEYEETNKKLRTTKDSIANDTFQLQSLMQSEEGAFAQKMIPPDYFYPAAIEKFIYFIRNGHADNMKEAVKEYDEYMHRMTIEYEAQLSRKNSEKAADYAKATAEAAADTAKATALMAQENKKMTREMKEQQDSIAFWTLYNATLLEDIKNGR